MRKSVELVLVAFGLLLLSLSGCAPASTAVLPTPELPTPTSMPSATETSIPTPTPWSLVAVGDSIPYNSPKDCPGCTSFVDRYAEVLTAATGHAVVVHNLSERNRLQIGGLLRELETDDVRREALANADIIIVGIAHNDIAWLSNDDLCDGLSGNTPDWSKYTKTCAVDSAERFRPKYENMFSQIVALRQGKPTIFRTINRYNDWLGWPELPPEGVEATHLVVDAWDDLQSGAGKWLCLCRHLPRIQRCGRVQAGGRFARRRSHPSFRQGQ